MPRAIAIKIGRFGGEAREFILNENATVNDALAMSGEKLKKGETLSIFGDTVRGTHELSEGDVIVIQPSTTGA
jgi:ribosome-associated protein YbcJ (S4-like RNA binding protein)